MTATRTLICEVYSDLLGVTTVADDDDFFLLGGHSMLAVIVTAEVGDALGVEVPLRLIFDHPTPSGFADAVDRHLGRSAPA
jgi:acyl carrier protein